ncbi:hypothetical protein SVIO_087900 [Streptomyces violaceusniger]|uniref:AMP-dependent synthetase/ligase domain-containing protein n=1 Tax=Streptomyces violaceusniger TaxID=68280 RepID=A0A4D4LID1_STRVO|nr:hypothetical protein SVIO_087900 [Streptomyces violaceusniger]
MPHAGIASLALTQADRFDVGAGSRVLQLASPGFDVSMMELVMAVATGATLIVPPAGCWWARIWPSYCGISASATP